MPILTPEERIGALLVGRYRLESILSARGMSVLFQGTDEATGTAVAVKMPRPTDELQASRVERFVRETRIAASLSHPNVGAVLEVGADEAGQPFIAMVLLHGRSLEEELAERGSIPLAEALDVIIPIGHALSAAHRRGIVHRDVKPGNIFLSRAEGRMTPKLLDFGIAKGPRDTFETSTGVVVGTPSYMAPEQASNTEVGPYTDIWGIAAVLYRCLTGRPPHGAGSVPELLARLIREPVPPLVAPGTPKRVGATVDRALHRDPHARYADMTAFIDALRRASEGQQDAECTAEFPVTPPPSEVSVSPVAVPNATPRPGGATGQRLPLVAGIAAGMAFAAWALAPREPASPAISETIAAASANPEPASVAAVTTAVPVSVAAVPPAVSASVVPVRAPRVRRTSAPTKTVTPATPTVAPAPPASAAAEIEPRSGLPFATKW